METQILALTPILLSPNILDYVTLYCYVSLSEVVLRLASFFPLYG